MKKLLALLLAITIISIGGLAQNKVTISLEDSRVAELLDAIEKQTTYRIFVNPEVIDTVRVTINCIDEEPLQALRKAFNGTTLKVTPYDKLLFILDGSRFIATLPASYELKKEVKDSIDVEYDTSYLSGQDGRRGQKLLAENRIYEIGSSLQKKTGRATVSGYITNYRNGEPMSGIAMFLKNQAISVTTDSKGYYSIQLPAGRQELTIQGINVKDSRLQLLVHSDGRLDFDLEEEIVLLDEATVSSERLANVRSTTIGMERIKMQDIKNIPSAFGEVDIIKAVMSLPGVKSVGEASSGFNVRGGATDQNLILFNDGTIYNPSHLFGIFSAFNPDVVSSMELYKSSIPSKYGGRISSVLDIVGKEGDKKEFHGSASLGLLTSRLTLEGPIAKDKTSFIVGGRTTYSDWMLNLLDEKSGYKDGAANFYDLNTTISHRFNERSSIYLNGYYSYDKFRFTEEQRYNYSNANVSLKWRHIFNDQFIGVLTTGYDHYGYNTDADEYPTTAYKLSFDINQIFGKLDFMWHVGNGTIDFGVNSIYYDLRPGKYTPFGSESLVEEDTMQKEKALESAAYLGYLWNITDKLSLNAGIRYSVFNALGPRTYNTYDPEYLPSLSTITGEVTEKSGVFETYHGPEFRVSARYAFTDDFSVKAGVNSMRQNIHKLSNTTIMSPTDTWKLSDVNIKPQTGIQIAGGVYKNFNRNTIETSIEGYYKTMDDYLDYRSGAELLMNHHIETDVLTTEGRAYGIEFMVKKLQGKLTGWVSYTYSKAELRQKDSRVEEPVNNGKWYPADFDKPHDFKFVGNYKLTHRFSFSLNCDYSTGRPITLPISKYQYAGGQFVFYSDRNEYRIPDFFRLDLSFNVEPSHHLTLLTHSSISFGVYNLTGRKNAYSVYYITETGKLKGYKLSIFGAPIPYISYNIKF